MPGNKVAASLGPPDTPSCLAELERLAPQIGLAEVRLDLMGSFDVEKLVDVVVVSEEIRWGFPRHFELAVFSNYSLDLFH